MYVSFVIHKLFNGLPMGYFRMNEHARFASMNIVSSSLIFATVLLSISSQLWASDLPDRTLTPSVLNQDVTQENIQQTVCVKGYAPQDLSGNTQH
jgi:hypothetical protein